jgi:GTP-binding protein
MRVEFITSAAQLEQCPQLNKPEIAIVGRSNVGKSSLINTLANRQGLARTSRTPGRTQLINFFDFPRFILADLPGYGYAKVSKTQQAHWRKELSRYLSKRKSLFGVIHLMDSRHPLLENDLEMRAFLESHEIPILTVLTKVDDLKQGELAKNRQKVENHLEQEVLLFSSKNGRGKQELISTILDGIREGSMVVEEVEELQPTIILESLDDLEERTDTSETDE